MKTDTYMQCEAADTAAHTIFLLLLCYRWEIARQKTLDVIGAVINETEMGERMVANAGMWEVIRRLAKEILSKKERAGPKRRMIERNKQHNIRRLERYLKKLAAGNYTTHHPELQVGVEKLLGLKRKDFSAQARLHPKAGIPHPQVKQDLERDRNRGSQDAFNYHLSVFMSLIGINQR